MNRMILTGSAVAIAASVFASPTRTHRPDEMATAADQRRVASAVTSFVEGADVIYGGSFVDGRGRTVVLVTRDVERVRVEFLARLGPGAPILVRRTRFSLADLDRVVRTLSNRLDDLRASGVMVASVAVDEQRNRVVVTLENDRDRARGAIRSAVAAADRPAVAFEVSAANVLE